MPMVQPCSLRFLAMGDRNHGRKSVFMGVTPPPCAHVGVQSRGDALVLCGLQIAHGLSWPPSPLLAASGQTLRVKHCGKSPTSCPRANHSPSSWADSAVGRAEAEPAESGGLLYTTGGEESRSSLKEGGGFGGCVARLGSPGITMVGLPMRLAGEDDDRSGIMSSVWPLCCGREADRDKASSRTIPVPQLAACAILSLRMLSGLASPTQAHG